VNAKEEVTVFFGSRVVVESAVIPLVLDCVTLRIDIDDVFQAVKLELLVEVSIVRRAIIAIVVSCADQGLVVVTSILFVSTVTTGFIKAT